MKEITCYVLFSRKWCVEPFFEKFEKMDIPEGKVHLAIICNSEDDALLSELQKRADKIEGKFLSCTIRRPASLAW